MEIIIANYSGFCGGVRRSVELAEEAIKNEGERYCVGPLIHNPQLVEKLENEGLEVVDKKEALKIKDSTVLIRAHGESADFKERLLANGNEVVDATCPVLNNIYKKIIEKENDGYQVVIVGDKTHPEIIAMESFLNNGIIVSDETEAKNIKCNNKLYVVSQTTNRLDYFYDIANKLKENNDSVVIENTICKATENRQEAAKSLAKEVDCMIVAGGFNSSNTNKLYQVANLYCKNVFRIETVKDLPLQKLSKFKKVGIIAGASTPDEIIEEVVSSMDEFTKEEFMNSLEDSLKKIYPKEIVKGTVIDVKDDEVFVDIQFRADGIIKLDEMTEEEAKDPKNSFNVGDEIDVFVIKLDDGEGNVSLSTRRVEGMKVWKDLAEKAENDELVHGVVSGFNKGGLTVNVEGINGFVPASQIATYFVKNFKKFVGEEWDLKIISIDERKNRLVLSRKEVVEDELDGLWEELEEGQVVTGKVARLTDFGAFVEVNGLDGLLHVSDIAWSRVEHPSDVLNVGDEIEVKILKLNQEKNRISLGRKQLLEKPFEAFVNQHEVGDVVTGKVVNLLDFGAFVEVADGVEGLVHVSEISWEHVEKPSDELNVGDEIEVKIISIDTDEEKVGLSIKALKEAPERPERRAKRAPRNNDRPRRRPERDNSASFGDDDLNNNLGNLLEQALSEQGSEGLLEGEDE
ncbi:30S ribosomal protein S1 [Anaerococcus prevotii]|uniref:4-hydroxy-3-methylbut-2-enyl diphosphate reductase n=1 Tax=Anaerococcus prevotii (strain ATCC 9321 / DSM 20548 / JCM 6508 / NCTC 11806 / PC1) TaxID=525919 RepID=C7RHT6_ANAPD|nr:bifunctional 4-hydroxy-3-methylbut-2-enyl diphosphate reductase/30S ribosomal protein S1 [Anaerococcus prevotii]ACV29047.1 hydroxymethylbutenyl pyrophosphate reductase [Anaerococcus prevotii DSM 20548]SUU94720.1 30S ribosomal protein S1 [Anaerococcus prevotii]